MAYKDKVRVNIALDPDVNERLIAMSKKFGISKTQLCAMMICQQIDTFEKTYEMLQNPAMFRKLVNEAFNEINDNMDSIAEAIKKNENKE